MRKDCPRFLKALVQKLQERSPLKYSFISYQKYHMFIMVTEPEAAKLHFNTFVEKLYSLNWMSDKSQRCSVITSCHKSAKSITTNFQNLIGKYDNMINFLVPSCTKIKNLAIFGTFVNFFCTLSWSECDQAWHGFSVNKDLLV